MSIMYCEKHDRRWDSDKLEICPLCENGLTTPEAQFEDICDELKVQMAPHLYEAVRVFHARLTAPLAEAGATEAALWSDLVLLHPMDLMVMFGGAGSNKVLLEKLAYLIEVKRKSMNSPRSEEK